MGYLILASSAISIAPIYLTSNIIYTSEISIVNNTVPFLTNFLYYALDIILLAPSIIILLNLNKQNPFIFHWFSITLAIAILVAGDLGYTYSAQISDELIEATHWIWDIFYVISYLFFVVGIFWYIKIKRMLYDKEIDNIKTNTTISYENVSKYEEYDYTDKKYDINENIHDKEQILTAIQEMIQNTNKHIDILLTIKSPSVHDDFKEILNILNQNLKIKNSLNVRILQPAEQNRNNYTMLLKRNNENVLIQYFETTFIFEAIIIIIDNEYLFIIEIKQSGVNGKNAYNARFTNNRLKLLSYISLFERTWLSEIASHISTG